MFNVVDKRDYILDAADNKDGDDANKKSINDQEDMFDVVEDDGDNLDTNERRLWMDSVFFSTLRP
jgi:hypothetical protein